MKRNLNQKLIDLIEYYNLTNINLLLNEDALKRGATDTLAASSGTKLQRLQKLKDKIHNIKTN